MQFKDKVVWITGASSGIGEALAYAFSKAGAKLVLSSRREQELNLVKAKCTNSHDVLVLPLDLVKFETLEEKKNEVLTHFGKIDILINNGGISQRSMAKDTALAVDQTIMDINYFGTVALTKVVLPFMLERKSGHIAVISSLVGKIGSPYRSAYAASKHALHGFFDSLRSEIWRDNIKVTIICPGFIKTNISNNAMTADGKPFGKMNDMISKGLPAGYCAEQILKAIAEEKEEVVIAGKEKVALVLKRLAPTLLSKIIRKAKVV
jgi:dehydrogenase/reductase SDR family protein 7B